MSPIPLEQATHEQPPIQWGNVASGIIILLIVGAAIFFGISYLLSPKDSGHYVPIVSYFPGSPDIDSTTKIFYKRSPIGKVHRVQPRIIALQLLVWKKGLVVQSQHLTITENESMQLLPMGERIHLLSLTRVLVESGEKRSVLTRNEDGSWKREGSLPPFRFGKEITDAVRDGDEFLFGDLRVVWKDIAGYTRVEALVDTEAVVNAGMFGLESGVGVREMLGIGSGLRLSSMLGLSRPVLRLEPSLNTDELAVGPTATLELLGKEDADIQKILNDIAAYATSEAHMNTPPSNRVEKVVADLNSTLDNLSATTANVTSLTGRLNSDTASGMIGRLLFNNTQNRALTSSLQGIDSALSKVNVIAGSLADSIAIRRIVARLDTSLGNVASITGALNDSLRYRHIIANVDSIVGNITRLSAELSDTTKPLLERIAGKEKATELIYAAMGMLAASLAFILTLR